MNCHWDRIVLVAAELVAIVLVVVFSRRLVLQPEKRGSLFAVALSFFVVFHSTANLGCTSPSNHTPAPHHDEPASASPTASTKASNVNAPVSLAVEDRWPRFKVFWQKLDHVEPNQHKGTDFERSFGGSYTRALTDQEQVAYRAELASILGLSVPELARFNWGPVEYASIDEGSLDPLTTILARLSMRRIERMGIPMELMSRMRPAPSSRYRGQVVEMMESRIDSLLALSKRTDVEPEVVSSALEKIQNDVYLSAVLELVKHYRAGYWGPIPTQTAAATQAKAQQKSPAAQLGPHWSEPSAWVRGLEQAHARNLENAKKSQSSVDIESISRTYRAVREKLDELQRLQPQLDTLIVELER